MRHSWMLLQPTLCDATPWPDVITSFETLEPALLAMYHHPQGHADGLTIALMARHVAG